MNEQAFTNALRAMRGDRRDYPEHKAPDPMKVALEALDEFEACLHMQRLLPPSVGCQSERQDHPCTELQARIEMRVQELRELITTGDIV